MTLYPNATLGVIQAAIVQNVITQHQTQLGAIEITHPTAIGRPYAKPDSFHVVPRVVQTGISQGCGKPTFHNGFHLPSTNPATLSVCAVAVVANVQTS